MSNPKVVGGLAQSNLWGGMGTIRDKCKVLFACQKTEEGNGKLGHFRGERPEEPMGLGHEPNVIWKKKRCKKKNE